MAMGLHQQSTGFSLGHLHFGFSAVHKSLLLIANQVMSLVTMVPTAELSMCPLRSSMHPSRMTIILIQLVLVKKKKYTKGQCQYLFSRGRLVWVNKTAIRMWSFTQHFDFLLHCTHRNDPKLLREGKEIWTSSIVLLIKAKEQLF